MMTSEFTSIDKTVMQHIYQQHYHRLQSYAQRIVKSRQDAQDIAMDVILRMLTRKETDENVNSIAGFLMVSTRNASYNLLMDRRRRRLAEKELACLSQERVVYVKDELIRLRVLQEIRALVEGLPPQCRAIFEQLFYHRKSTAEVAAMLQLRTQTVLNQKNKAATIIRAALLKKRLGPSAWTEPAPAPVLQET